MKRVRKWMLVYLLLAGCDLSNPTLPVVTPTPQSSPISFTPTIRSTSSPTPDMYAFTQSLLNQAVCELPCWEGITPGVTYRDEAEKMIVSLSYVVSDSIKTQSYPTGDVIWWDWINHPDGGNFYAGDNDGVVEGIQLYFPHSFFLKDLFTQIGEPEYVIAQAGFSPHGDVLFNFVQIFYFELGVRGLVSTHKFSLESELELVDLFPKTTAETWGVDAKTLLVPWQGFRDLEFYCRDELNGEACDSVLFYTLAP